MGFPRDKRLLSGLSYSLIGPGLLLFVIGVIDYTVNRNWSSLYFSTGLFCIILGIIFYACSYKKLKSLFTHQTELGITLFASSIPILMTNLDDNLLKVNYIIGAIGIVVGMALIILDNKN